MLSQGDLLCWNNTPAPRYFGVRQGGFFRSGKNHSCVLKNQLRKRTGQRDKKPTSFKGPYSNKFVRRSASYRGLLKHFFHLREKNVATPSKQVPLQEP